MRILPRPFGQVLNDALASLGRVWRPLLSTSLLVFIPGGVVTLLIFQTTGATDFLRALFNDTGYLQTLPPEVFFELARPFLIAVALTLIVQALATIYVYVVCHRVVVADIRGESLGGRQARRPGARRVAVALAAGLIALILAAGAIMVGLTAWSVPAGTVGTPNPTSGVIALVLLVGLLTPGIWLAIALSMVTPVAAIEGRGVVASLYRSRQLVRGRWWPTLGFLLLVGLMGSAAIQLIQLVAIPLSAAGEVSSGLSLVSALGIAAQGPIAAAMGATFTHWYIDLRSRREAVVADQL